MEIGLDPKTGLVSGTRLEEILRSEANWEGLSQLGKMNWLNELNMTIAEGLAWTNGGGALRTLYGEGKTVEFLDANGNKVSGTIDSVGNVVGEDFIYDATSFSMDRDGNISTSLAHSEAQ